MSVMWHVETLGSIPSEGRDFNLYSGTVCVCVCVRERERERESERERVLCVLSCVVSGGGSDILLNTDSGNLTHGHLGCKFRGCKS